MQLIHLTYRWPSTDPEAEKRINAAHASWVEHCTPQIYTPMHLTPKDVSFDSTILGDQQPYPILKDLINKAFSKRKDDATIVAFVNTDIGLFPNAWPILQRIIQFQITKYEDCEHTRARINGEAQSTPVTFYFSYKWWVEHEIRIPPVLFACPYWERPFQIAIDRYANKPNPELPTTWHVPHEFWTPFNNWRDPAAMYNHALSTGWEANHFDAPSFGRGLKLKFKVREPQR